MSDKPNILFVAHNSVYNTSFGGVEAYLNNVTKYLSDDFDVYWYVPGFGEDQNSIYLYGPDGCIPQKIVFDSAFTNWQLSCPKREAAFATVLQELKIRLVHFHHLAGQPPSLVKTAKDNGVATAFTFHDFYSICHVSNLINFEGKYCQPDTLAPADCDACLNKKYGIEPGSQVTRRAYWNNLFSDINGLIFNTQGGFELVAKIYPNVANHPNVKILPVAIESIEIPQVKKRDGDELKVAILGNFVHHKGADLILDAIKNLTSENISFHFFGEIEGVYEEKIKLSKNPNIYLYGKYPSGKLPLELFSCEVSLHVSICPETYGLSLSEAWAAGLIPIGSNIGALGERIIDGVNGVKVEVGSSAALTKAILKFAIDKNLAKGLSEKVELLPNGWIGDHAKQLIIYYKRILVQLKRVQIHPIHHKTDSAKTPLFWASFNIPKQKNGSKIRKYLQKLKALLFMPSS